MGILQWLPLPINQSHNFQKSWLFKNIFFALVGEDSNVIYRLVVTRSPIALGKALQQAFRNKQAICFISPVSLSQGISWSIWRLLRAPGACACVTAARFPPWLQHGLPRVMCLPLSVRVRRSLAFLELQSISPQDDFNGLDMSANWILKRACHIQYSYHSTPVVYMPVWPLNSAVQSNPLWWWNILQLCNPTLAARGYWARETSLVHLGNFILKLKESNPMWPVATVLPQL